MWIIARKRLKEFWEKHPDAEESLKVWYYEAKKAKWKSFNELKEQFGSASIIGDNRVVFNIKGNKYRLIALILFKSHKMLIRFIDTHKEYDKIDAKNI